MSYLRSIISDLREKRLWPIVAGLLVALVAVPVVLSSNSSGAPATVAQLPPTGALPPQPSIPAVSVTGTPSRVRLTGSSRNPFTQIAHATSPAGTSTTPSNTGTGTGTGSGSGTTTTSTTATTAPPSATTTPTTTIPTTTPKPAPAGLTDSESYSVALALTSGSGGLDTLEPLERLSVLPDVQRPLLVELGVLKGGSRVLFAVQPGTAVGGPGTCIPGPVDCEILSLAQDRTEQLSTRSATGVVPVGLFAVTGITAARHGSSAAANKVRRAESAAGRALLNRSTLDALSLFKYDPSAGAVIDLRNLKVGGN